MWFDIARLWRKWKLHREREQFRLELAEELALHAELKRRDLVQTGITPDQAEWQTRRQMGNATLAREQAVDLRSFLSLENFMQDFLFSLRLFRKSPAFTLVAVLSLALGIAGNTAVFSVVNALLIRPLPFPNPDRLVRITAYFPKALQVFLVEHCRTVEISAVSPGVDVNISGIGPAFRITASASSANLFAVLGVSPARGRAFQQHEDQPGRDRVAIIGDGLWKSQFHSDPGVIGQSIAVNGINRQIIGIMPASFVFPSARVQLWFPAALDPSNMEDYWAGEFVPVLGRLRDGVTMEQARSEIHSLAAPVWTLFPFPMPRNWGADATVISLQTDLAGESRGRLLMLLSAVGAVLLIACANVASLLLARATTRRKEIALRAALGAGKGRIVRQLLTESVVLAAIAGALGLLLGGFAMQFFTSLVSSDVPGMMNVGIDWVVAGFAAALALFTGLSFGLVPALSASRLSLATDIRTGSQRSATGSSLRLRSFLIAGEIALTLMLVVGAGLLIKSVQALTHVDTGYDASHTFAIKLSPDQAFCGNPAACVSFYGQLSREAGNTAGVLKTALANAVPLDGSMPAIAVDVEGYPKTAEFPAPMFWAAAVSPEYLDLLGIPLLEGRRLTVADTLNSEPVLLLTAATAKRFWPGQSALGKHVKSVSEPRWRTVVGVVADVRQFNLENRTPSFLSGAMYMPYPQSIQGDRRIPVVMNLLVKTAGHAPLAASEIHRLALARNPNIPVGKVVYLEELAWGSIAKVRTTTRMLLAFAAAALILATIGIYGLVSYSVSQRTYEIGLRMAIGASHGSIVRMILTQSLRVALAGLIAGLIGAVFAARTLSTLLFNVAPIDPFVYLCVPLVLCLVAAAASALPAWRAARIDPIRVLRAE